LPIIGQHQETFVQPIDYSHAAYPIRDDFAAAHNRYWQRLGRPGAWLTGAQRVDVAREVRQAGQCGFCQRRLQALSPSHVDGAHDTASNLSAAMVEVIHRVVTDPKRLTRKWFDGIMAQGLSEDEYVEIIGIVVCVFSIDEFCRAIGVPPHPLPEPVPGEPSRYRPANVVHDGAWVRTLPKVVDSGPEADLWQGIGGFVIRALSLVPDETRSMLDLLEAHYVSNANIWDLKSAPKGTFSRIQSEIIAIRVSALNGCFY
jgi:hypothetical protein